MKNLGTLNEFLEGSNEFVEGSLDEVIVAPEIYIDQAAGDIAEQENFIESLRLMNSILH